MRISLQTLTAIFAAPLLAASVANAAVVSYTASVYDADSDISTDGTQVASANLGSATTITHNGVDFTGGNTLGLISFTAGYLYGGGAIGSLSVGDANTLLDSLEFAGGGGNSLAQLTGLISGHKYEVQLLLSSGGTQGVNPGASNTTDVGYATPSGNATEVYPILGLNTNATPQVVTGTFLADESTQDLHVATSAAGNAQISAFQLRDISGPTLIGDAAGGAHWILTVPTLGAYDNAAGGPNANIYFDADGDLDFNAIDGDTTGNTDASLALTRRIENGEALNFYMEDFADLETFAGITLSGLDIELTNGTVLDNLAVTEGTPTRFFDSTGQKWQIDLDVIDGGGGSDIVDALNSETGGGGPDEQFVLTFTEVPTPAALPAGLGLLAVIAMRRRR